MLSKLLSIIGLAAAGLLLFMVTTVTPGAAGAAGILIVFILAYIVSLCLLTFLIWLFVRAIEKISKKAHVLRNLKSFSLAKSYYYSSVVSLGLVIVLSLRSVGSVSIYEFSLVVLFVTFGCIYIARMTR